VVLLRAQDGSAVIEISWPGSILPPAMWIHSPLSPTIAEHLVLEPA
jgi:hypothetical protein